MFGFWWARTSGSESWLIWATGLKWTLITLALCAGYMAAVGLYHTILAALGLDGQPGIFSKGARTGPFSGLPERGPAESDVSSKAHRYPISSHRHTLRTIPPPISSNLVPSSTSP